LLSYEKKVGCGGAQSLRGERRKKVNGREEEGRAIDIKEVLAPRFLKSLGEELLDYEGEQRPYVRLTSMSKSPVFLINRNASRKASSTA
jgi:hypothetical protein